MWLLILRISWLIIGLGLGGGTQDSLDAYFLHSMVDDSFFYRSLFSQIHLVFLRLSTKRLRRTLYRREIQAGGGVCFGPVFAERDTTTVGKRLAVWSLMQLQLQRTLSLLL